MTHATSSADRTVNPILATVTRGAYVESHHRGAAVVFESTGRVVAQWGDPSRPIIPRSALKPLQAMAMVESGAADHFDLGPRELAIACASHSGAARHVKVLSRWLARLGLGVDDLVCGGHAPSDRPTRDGLIRGRRAPTRLHDNCSGKHAAMMTTARYLDLPTDGYERTEHPVQQRIRDILSDMTGSDLSPSAAAMDGCGVPTYGMPLGALATGIARFATTGGLAPARAQAARRLYQAVVSVPEMIAGPERFDAALIAAADGDLLVKGGAEGVMVAAAPRLELGFAVKIDDGAARAVEAVMAALLQAHGGLSKPARARLADFAEVPVQTRHGVAVGNISANL